MYTCVQNDQLLVFDIRAPFGMLWAQQLGTLERGADYDEYTALNLWERTMAALPLSASSNRLKDFEPAAVLQLGRTLNAVGAKQTTLYRL